MQHDHASLIDRLGGGKELQKALSDRDASVSPIKANAVYMWKKNGVPWRWRPAVARIAVSRGVTVPPGFLDPAHAAAAPAPADLQRYSEGKPAHPQTNESRSTDSSLSTAKSSQIR